MKKLGLLLFLLNLTACVGLQYPEESPDGLQLLPDTQVDAVYTRPDADLSIYKRVKLNHCEVAFTRNWQRDQNQGRSLFNQIKNRDVAKIKSELSEICRNSFVEELSNNGYEVVEENAADVLLITPAVIDLDIAAPDVGTSARTTTYVASAGSMRLILELHDALSGQVLARAIDKKKARHTGRITWANSVSNRREANQMFRQWSRMLREQLDSLK